MIDRGESDHLIETLYYTKIMKKLQTDAKGAFFPFCATILLRIISLSVSLSLSLHSPSHLDIPL